MSLRDEIDKARQEIKTDHYPMSIGEWITMYKEGELDIHPEFQRYYRWSDEQKTNLIESLFLGIPIPPIFVSQRENGIWDVIDGLQRLSTIFQLMGILKDEEGKLLSPLTLNDTKYLPSFAQWSWVKGEDEDETELDTTLKLIIKRTKLNVSIVLKESDENVKYELFQRLNTGGSSLSDQEVRNCILVMLNPEMHRWLEGLSAYEPFQQATSLSDSALAKKYDMDLALRFVVFHDMANKKLTNVGDINIFLTEQMREIATTQDYDYDAIGEIFRNTFDQIMAVCDEGPFRRYTAETDRFLGGFLVSMFEVVALGIGYNTTHNMLDLTLNKIKSIFDDEEYQQWSGRGLTATRRLPRLIPLGRELFSDEN